MIEIHDRSLGNHRLEYNQTRQNMIAIIIVILTPMPVPCLPIVLFCLVVFGVYIFAYCRIFGASNQELDTYNTNLAVSCEEREHIAIETAN